LDINASPVILAPGYWDRPVFFWRWVKMLDVCMADKFEVNCQ